MRGTVQADILKEDQAQNTCIFSTEFAMRMMGDVQQYFIDHGVRNFYSVSISGYHIAEAGANPISQLAFTLANGFTIVEYYLARGMEIDEFAPNLSFFFSNGMDPEYAVIGRVARRIWARAMRERYGAGPRSQMLKYHIQTSGRSLHAQEIQFNDIRTTLQALYAIFDNCNSLHTNAYDEAITTPTEESRAPRGGDPADHQPRARAELHARTRGRARSSIEELTDLVEEAVYDEFDRISERGGVLGAMDTMYQRGKIQEESALLRDGSSTTARCRSIGVNTFLPREPVDDVEREVELMRSSDSREGRPDRQRCVRSRVHADRRPASLARLRDAARPRATCSKRCWTRSSSHRWVRSRGALRRRRGVPAQHVASGTMSARIVCLVPSITELRVRPRVGRPARRTHRLLHPSVGDGAAHPQGRGDEGRAARPGPLARADARNRQC